MYSGANACGACGGDDFEPPVRLRELMYASGETFDYLRCRDCGCLQIAAFPDDMARHYPDDYYSFGALNQSLRDRVRDWLTLNGPARLFGEQPWYRRGGWRSLDGIARTARIVDVGCGDGSFICRLRQLGFAHVCGIDAFIEGDRVLPGGVPVYRKTIENLDDTFDVVMMHHSLEHMPDQLGVLAKARDVFSDGGRLIVRIPVVDSWAAEEFGKDWAHLDPPRHFFLHTRKSISALVERAGLALDRVVDEWSEFGVRGSLLARSGKPSISTDPLDGPELEVALADQRRASAQSRSDTIAVHAHRP